MKTFQQFCEDSSFQNKNKNLRDSENIKKQQRNQSNESPSRNYNLKRKAAIERQQSQVAQVRDNVKKMQIDAQRKAERKAQERTHQKEYEQLKKDIRKEVEDEFEEHN